MDKKYLSNLHEQRRRAQEELDRVIADNKRNREAAEKKLEAILLELGYAETKYHALK